MGGSKNPLYLAPFSTLLRPIIFKMPRNILIST
ncbi:MAG: hypothetical protein ACI8SR_002972, partial [Oceanicoccus sp.]